MQIASSPPLSSVTLLSNSVELRPTALLHPYTYNPRTHSKKQIRQIADSIRRFGFVNPILIDADGGVVAGHGRLEAAKLLKLVEVPTLRIDHLTDTERRAYIIADNRLAEKAGWDKEILSLELQALIDLDFEVQLTGFETPEIDLLFSAQTADVIDLDEYEPPSNMPSVSRHGDLWMLGAHRIYCGDATQKESYVRLLGNDRAQMIFTDPPYNVAINGHVCGKGAAKHSEFAMASGEMNEAQFTVFLNAVAEQLTTFAQDGAIHFICMDWRHIHELLNATRSHYGELKNLCIWNKDNGGMGSLYRSKHELIFVFKQGKGAHINNIELGKHGRYRTNVWNYPGANSPKNNRTQSLGMHPTVKPVALVADAIQDCSHRNGLILDPFSGSGTTLIAAHSTGRRAAVMELDPKYVDTAILRYQKLTGDKAVHADTGQLFDEVRISCANTVEETAHV